MYKPWTIRVFCEWAKEKEANDVDLLLTAEGNAE